MISSCNVKIAKVRFSNVKATCNIKTIGEGLFKELGLSKAITIPWSKPPGMPNQQKQDFEMRQSYAMEK